MTEDDALPSGRTSDGKFAPGNPGKQRGVRWRQSRAAEDLLDGEAEKLTRKAVDLALAGDSIALRLCLERLVPPRRDRTIEFDMPAVTTAGDHPPAISAILVGVAGGIITPQEGQALAAVLEQHRRSVETVELEARLKAIEESQT